MGKPSMNKRLRLTLFLSLALIIALFPFCIQIWERFRGVTLEEIKKKGTLKVITAYNANSYFIFKGTPMGYEYELLKLLAERMGVKLELQVTSDMDNILYMLNNSDAHIIAANLAVSRRRAREVEFTERLLETRQVLVQRRKRIKLKNGEVNYVTEVKTPSDLVGKTVYVRKNSRFYTRLKSLQDEIGGDIDIQIVPGDQITEALIQKVHKGEIDFTIADEPTALINKAYYANLDVSVPISLPQKIAWVVKSSSPELSNYINKWIEDVQKDGTLARIYEKYYKNPRGYRDRVASKFYSKKGDKISRYDKLIKKYADQIGWDWRLLAALIHQESRFNPRARSWAGAQGLMQIMPDTGKRLGLNDPYDPESNIKAGVRHLKWLTGYWKRIKNKNEKLKFVLASYNAGHGHIQDARRLARKFGKNPNIWSRNVAPYVLNLSDPDYYHMKQVKFGYLRGSEPFEYVSIILDNYEKYKEFYKKSKDEGKGKISIK